MTSPPVFQSSPILVLVLPATFLSWLPLFLAVPQGLLPFEAGLCPCLLSRLRLLRLSLAPSAQPVPACWLCCSIAQPSLGSSGLCSLAPSPLLALPKNPDNPQTFSVFRLSALLQSIFSAFPSN